MNAQKSKKLSLLEPIDIVIPCRSKIKKWAFDNAYTLIFVGFFFFLSWMITLIAALWTVHQVNR